MFNTFITISLMFIIVACIIDIILNIKYHIFDSKPNNDIEIEVGTPPPVSRGYDVDAFRKRMDEFKKEYYEEDVLLYDLPPVFTGNPDDNFTGVEIITPEYEAMVDRKVR